MTLVIGILLGFIGAILVLVGLAFFVTFRFALRHFDQSLKTEFAAQSREQIESVVMKIGNPLVRNFVQRHLVQTGGSISVSLVRGAIESRKRTGLYMAIAGAGMLVASLLTRHWLPFVTSAV